MARHTSGSGSGFFVTALTAAALAVVAFFAYQASAAEDRPAAAAPPSESPSADAAGGQDGGQGSGEDADEPSPTALPEDSGAGRRVVYALEQRRVWLVDTDEDGGEQVTGTFEVFPSSVSPEPGEYAVTSRNPAGTGSDGVPMEHAVIFHQDADGVVFGFSAATDGSTPDPDGEQRTGGIRQSRADGAAMWQFAEAGTTVVVVP
ncbi:hypothetical protein [Streptomyces sp. RFCAC02]|uniref:hypothetical protein n=1 Tax=Streptomyces sp. RFCAC02 TaxID=2499143 RepID=UPI00101F7707|nr:hypothetical protein [Streptomyces sp. RFCAC02]